jgi:hypothetical protein
VLPAAEPEARAADAPDGLARWLTFTTGRADRRAERRERRRRRQGLGLFAAVALLLVALLVTRPWAA